MQGYNPAMDTAIYIVVVIVAVAIVWVAVRIRPDRRLSLEARLAATVIDPEVVLSRLSDPAERLFWQRVYALPFTDQLLFEEANNGAPGIRRVREALIKSRAELSADLAPPRFWSVREDYLQGLGSQLRWCDLMEQSTELAERSPGAAYRLIDEASREGSEAADYFERAVVKLLREPEWAN